MARRMSRRLRLLVVAAVLPLVLFALSPMISDGQNLGSKIKRKQDQIQWRKGREHVLSSDIATFTHKINALQGQITPGDLVVFITDGIREVMSPDDKLYGIQRVLDVVRGLGDRCAQAIAEGLCNEALAFSLGAPQGDDVTAVIIKVGTAS